jgi:hypothetical protein
MRPPRPVSPTLKVRDLGQDDLEIRCPKCQGIKFRTGYDLGLELPGDMLVLRYVTRHVCRECGVRAEGFVRPFTRSGAERS